MKRIPISYARATGERLGARRVVMIGLDADGFCITTWGKTRAECRALAEWAESSEAQTMVAAIHGAGEARWGADNQLMGTLP